MLTAIAPLPLCAIRIGVLPPENVIALGYGAGSQVCVVLHVTLCACDCVALLISVVLGDEVVVSLNLCLVLIKSLGFVVLIILDHSTITCCSFDSVCVAWSGEGLGGRVDGGSAGRVSECRMRLGLASSCQLQVRIQWYSMLLVSSHAGARVAPGLGTASLCPAVCFLILTILFPIF